MDLVDIRLHHLVLLLNDGAGWKGSTLVTLLPGLPDAFESRILGAHVVLEGVHLLGGACHCASHLELRMSKLLAFASLVWLCFRIDLETLVGVILLLAGWSAGQGRRGTVPRNFALIRVVECKSLTVTLLAIALTDHLIAETLAMLELYLLDVSPGLGMARRAHVVASLQ